mgnify:CR=1 FL=1
MFDPFKDFDTAGYLRNFAAEKDLDIVKAAEHELFRANLPEVVHHLATLTQITYADFCQVHKILFQGLYPWAGQDRSLTAPDSGDVLFYPGGYSETEIIMAYGSCSFSSKMGQLAGNHFLTIIEGREHLREVGLKTLWEGAQDVCFELMEDPADDTTHGPAPDAA